MRETVSTMRAYLLLTGILGTPLSLGWFVGSKANLLLAPSVVIALGSLYLGLFLRRLLTTSPRWVLRFFLASAAWLAFVLAANLGSNHPEFVARPLIGLLMMLYLWWNARRLATELQKSST